MFGLTGGIDTAKTDADSLFDQGGGFFLLPSGAVNDPRHPDAENGKYKILRVHKYSWAKTKI